MTWVGEPKLCVGQARTVSVCCVEPKVRTTSSHWYHGVVVVSELTCPCAFMSIDLQTRCGSCPKNSVALTHPRSRIALRVLPGFDIHYRTLQTKFVLRFSYHISVSLINASNVTQIREVTWKALSLYQVRIRKPATVHSSQRYLSHGSSLEQDQ